MNPADPQHPWRRLIAAARRAPVVGEASAPLGFSTRVAALALAVECPTSSLFERLAPRAVMFACLLALGSVAFNYPAISTAHAEEDVVLFSGDPVSALLDPS